MRIAGLVLTFFPLAHAGGQAVQRPRVEAIPAQRVTMSTVKHNHSYEESVDAAKGWIDTGIPLIAGDQVAMSATGTVTLASGQTVTADGMTHLWRDLLRSYPLPTANTGALIGRIGSNPAAYPFLIGGSNTLTTRTYGNLFVRANLSEQITGTGTFKLTVSFAEPVATAPPGAVRPELVKLLQPTIFDTLPRRDDDGRGNLGDAVNFALMGTEQQVRDAFTRSGWFAVDADRNIAILHGLLSTLSREPYREVPMSTLYLFGRSQDLSFARGDTLRVAAERHHVRLWQTTQTVDGKPLWVGSATYDNGFELDDRDGGITHSIAPAIDDERNFLRDSLDSSGSYSGAAYVTPVNPVREATTATGGSYHTDGRILVMELD